MKIKPVGKIAIIIVVCVIAFFVIKNYQKSHPSPVVVKADTAVISKQLDTALSLAAKKDTSTMVSAQPRASAKIPVHHEQVKKATPSTTKTKKKDDRENVKLDTY